GVDVEMTLDRVRLTTGHWASLHRPSVSSTRAPSRLDRAMARPPGGSLAEVVAVGCQDAGGKSQDPHGGGDDADNDDPGPVLRGRLGGTGGYHDPQNESDQRHRDARDVAEDDESTGAVAPDVGCGAVVRCVVDGPVFAVWSGWCCSAHPRYLSSDRRADAERLATRDTAALTATTVNGVSVGSGVLADIELAERPDSSGPDVARAPPLQFRARGSARSLLLVCRTNALRVVLTSGSDRAAPFRNRCVRMGAAAWIRGTSRSISTECSHVNRVCCMQNRDRRLREERMASTNGG